MSHMTIYVHMITSQSLGKTGPTQNYFYTRLQPVGGSKCSNDTASTFFDFLHGSAAKHLHPPIFRMGYDAGGRIPGKEVTHLAAAAFREAKAAEKKVTERWGRARTSLLAWAKELLARTLPAAGAP